MSDPNKAVFLSYASQDAEAARRICEALRAANVEVWFDQSELRGGDSWDAKIRKQIKDCALFVPVVSAHTQARLEGYFRLEWHLAERRMQHMHEEAAFLLPVVIDAEINEANARVPGKFLDVQWTRLVEGEDAAAIASRVQALLSGLSATPARPTEAPRRDSASAAPLGNGKRPAPFPVWATVAIVVTALGVGAMFAFKPFGQRKNSATPPSTVAVRAPVVPSGTEAEQLVARVRNILKIIGFTRDDLALAEDFARRATELEPTLASAWALRAQTQVLYTVRGWDKPDKRARDTQTFASRALALQPEQPDALLARGLMLSYQGADTEQIEGIFRRLIAVAPNDANVRRNLGVILGLRGQPDRALVLLEDARRLDPQDALVCYNLATHWSARGDPVRAIGCLNEALALEPGFANALLLKASLAIRVAGDLKTMRESLDRLTPSDRADDRAVYYAIWGGLLERNLNRALAAAAYGTNDYLVDNAFTGAKAHLIAHAYRVAGQDHQARVQWQSAEAVLRRRIRDDPIENRLDRARLALALAWLGQTEEAAREIAEMEKTASEAQRIGSALALAQYYAAIGDAEHAVPHLQFALTRGRSGGLGGFSVHHLQLEPFWDKLRGKPAFEVLLKEEIPPPTPNPGAAPAVQKTDPSK